MNTFPDEDNSFIRITLSPTFYFPFVLSHQARKHKYIYEDMLIGDIASSLY